MWRRVATMWCREYKKLHGGVKKADSNPHTAMPVLKKSLGSFGKWLIARRGNKAHFCIISQLHFICNISNNWRKLWKKLWAHTPKKNPFVFKDDNKVSRIPFHFFFAQFASQKDAKFSHFSLFPFCWKIK